jgi:predicted methyltransferase
MLRSIRFALRPNGRFIVVDFERIPGQSREWVLGHVRADKKTVRKEIEQAGFVFDGEPSISELTENYVLRFRRP